MPGDYSILANIHDEIHLGAFAQHMTSRLVDYAQRNQWMGRQIVDLGCGTGISLHWLSQHGYIVTGVDESPEMLQIAQAKLQGLNVRLLESSIRNVDNIKDVDMALCLDTLHELNNLRDLEEVFQHVHAMLKQEKLFIFDIYTIEGLAQRHQQGDALEYNNNDLTIFTRNNFDYERQVQRREYIIFHRDGEIWHKQDTFRVLRAYPIQGITALVKRSGFEVLHVLNADLSIHNPGDHTSRVIIMAQKR
jgi:SAM-dependent methyltransferase